MWMQYRPKVDGHPLDSLRPVGHDPEGVREVLRDCVERLGITSSDDMIEEIAGYVCEGDYVTSSIAFKCDLSSAAADSPTVTIREGMIHVGNPFNGNGALVEWEGELTVPRDCVELDGDVGYGVQEIFGL